MPITASAVPDRPRFLIPPGAHVARCFKVIDLGTHERTYQGQSKGHQRKVWINWELSNELMDVDGKQLPAAIGKEFGLSLHEKAALYKFLTAWRGKAFTPEELKGFDLTKLLGAPCLLNVVHETKEDGKVRANIASVSPVPKGMTVPAQANPSFTYSIDEDGYGEKFRSMHQWMQERIQKSEEYLKSLRGTEVAPPAEDDPVQSGEGDSEVPF